MEPNLADGVCGALYAPTGGIVCPFNMTIALAENAFENGVEFNSEKETFLEDADVLRSFFEASGFIKWFEKKKDAIGVLCSLDSSGFEAHLELEKVNSLLYIEIEYTKEDLPADEVRSNLEKILHVLGVDPKKRDSRSWAEIIN